MDDRPYDDELTVPQGMSLLNEAQSAQNLLRDGVDAIANLRYTVLHSDAMFTLASIGVEKAMKLVLGSSALRDSGRWPAVKAMKSWGHDLDTMNGHLLDTLTASAHLATNRGYVDDALESVQADPLWPLIVAALSRYGRSGRFFYLDHLASGEYATEEPPGAYWDRVEQAIVKAHPHLLSGLASFGTAEHDAATDELCRHAAASLDRWWYMLYQFGVQGCLGDRGGVLAIALWPIGRKPLRQA